MINFPQTLIMVSPQPSVTPSFFHGEVENTTNRVYLSIPLHLVVWVSLLRIPLKVRMFVELAFTLKEHLIPRPKSQQDRRNELLLGSLRGEVLGPHIEGLRGVVFTPLFVTTLNTTRDDHVPSEALSDVSYRC